MKKLFALGLLVIALPALAMMNPDNENQTPDDFIIRKREGQRQRDNRAQEKRAKMGHESRNSFKAPKNAEPYSPTKK